MSNPIRIDSFEHKLIGDIIRDIIREYPETSEVMKKYFDEDCLKRSSFRIKTLEAAYIFIGMNQDGLIRELEKTQD